VGPRVILDTVVKRKILSARRESNPSTPIVQPVTQSLYRLSYHGSPILIFCLITGAVVCICISFNLSGVRITWDSLEVRPTPRPPPIQDTEMFRHISPRAGFELAIALSLEGFTAVMFQVQVFWVVTPCSVVGG
jgi:hypothetical protein